MMTKSTPSTAAYGAILLVTLCMQLLLVGISMPLSSVLAGMHGWYIDNPYHVYQIDLGRSLLQQGLLSGYDPYFGAGYVGGVTYNISARIPVLIAALMPASVSSGAVYSGYVLACALLAPLAIVGMARQLRWPAVHTALAAALGIAFWWIGAIRWYYSAGMVSFALSIYLALFYGSWIWNVCARPAAAGGLGWRLALAGLAGGACLWLHPLFAPAVVAVFAALTCARWREVQVGAFAWRGALIAVVSLVVNLPWIRAMLASDTIAGVPIYQIKVGLAVAVQPMLGKWSDDVMGTPLNTLVVVVCLVGLFTLAKDARRRAAPLLLAGAGLLVFAAYGSLFAILGAVQSNRFLAPAFLYLGIAAAYCLGEWAIWLRVQGKPLVRALAGAAVLVVCAYVAKEVAREVTPGPHGHYGHAPEVSAPPPIEASLQAWIEQNTTADGRILFETSVARVHGGGHIAGLLALRTQREFLGAPYPFSLPAAAFWDKNGLGKPLAALSPAQLSDGLDYYNVGWAIVHSDELAALLGQLGQVKPVAQFGKIRVFKVERALSYVVTGSARIVARSFNRIEVSGASGPELVLRYNWVPGLRTEPATRIEAVRVSPDYPPYVRIVAPPAHFVISLCKTCAAK